MSWRLARSLETLRDQINKLAPGRSKASDGTIGDAAHSSRTSDHNPDSRGVVCALDLTHDPEDGMDAQVLADVLVASRDPRIKYIIWNKQIVSPTTSPWKWRKYTGANPHTKHVHISVNGATVLADDVRPWAVPGAVPPPTGHPVTQPKRPTLQQGASGTSVIELQQLLGGLVADGHFGPKTLAKVKQFQAGAGLVADGIVGPYTWAALTAKGEKK